MKIKDVLGENKKSIAQMDEDGVTVAGVSGDKAKLSNGQEVDAMLLSPDTQHPGQFTMPEMDPAAIKPGSVVNTGDEQQTSEEVGDEEEHPGHKHYNDWMNSEYAPQDDDSGDDNRVHIKAIHFLHSKGVHPGDMEYHATHMAHKFHNSGIDEGTHRDLVSQGNHDIGGDATDRFIDQVRDKGFERAQRKGKGRSSPISGKLAESDELMKWLTIAGIK